MIGLVHLVWAPLGPGPLRRFLHSYDAREAGSEHELTILLNGLGAPGAADRGLLLGEVGERPHRLVELAEPALDLAAYLHAVAQLDHARLCFLNSYAEPLADGWLRMLAGALDAPKAGLAGASGSWESQAEWRRGRLRHRPQQLAALSQAWRDYPRFPNPHVRTSSFAIDRALLLELTLEPPRDKRDAYLVESGYRSITRLVQERGLRALVADRAGRIYDVPDWPASRTFRSSEQEGLLVADNQTRDYQEGSSARRRQLARDSWGRGNVER